MRPLTIALLAVTAGLAIGCSNTPRGPSVRLGSQTVALQEITAAEVAAAVRVTERDGDIIYRAPTLGAYETADLRRGGPTLGVNLGTVTPGQSGFLYGVRRRDSGAIRHFGSFHSDFVEGTNRFVSMAMSDGRPLRFTLASNRDRCEPNCYFIVETLTAEIPESELRAAPESGMTLAITLDNGTVIRPTVPAAYIRGYLQAVAGK
jgi:hypothetical protein